MRSFLRRNRPSAQQMMTEQFPPRPAPAPMPNPGIRNTVMDVLRASLPPSAAPQPAPAQPFAGPAQAFPSLAQPFPEQPVPMQNPYATPEFAQKLTAPMQSPYGLAAQLRASMAQGPAQPIPAEEMSWLKESLGQPPALGQGPMQMSPGMGQPVTLSPQQIMDIQRVSQLSAMGGGIGALYGSPMGQAQPPTYGPSQQSPFEPLQQPPLGQGPMPVMFGQPQRPPLGQGPMQSPFGQSPMQSQQSAFGKGIPQMPSSFGQSQQPAFGQGPMQSQQSAFGQSPMQSQQASNQSGGGGRLF